MNNSKKIRLVIIAIFLVLLLISSSTYAYWLWRGNITNISFKVEIPFIGLSLDGGEDETIDLAPSRCNHPRFADKKVITISRYNQSRYPAKVTIRYNLESFTWTKGSTAPTVNNNLKYIKFAISSVNYDTNNTSETCTNLGTLSSEDITYIQSTTVGTGKVGSLGVSGVNVGTINTPVANQNKKLLTWEYELPAQEGTEAEPIVETYYLYTWIDPSYTGVAMDPTQNGSGVAGIADPLQGMSFLTSWSADGNITQYEGTGESSNPGAGSSGGTNGDGSLYNTILLADNNSATVENAISHITSKTEPSFSSKATTDMGLYDAEDDTGTVYYYRGAVNDNHVVFGGFCWEIIRTTGTGGVKMIYDGVPGGTEDAPTCSNTGANSYLTTPSSSAFNSLYSSPADVGYMYGTRYTYSSVSSTSTSYSGEIVYGNYVSYSDGTGYTLKNTMESTWNTDYSKDYTTIAGQSSPGYHYTCLTTSDTCSSVKYIYYMTSSTIYYITLSNGKTIETALNDMFTNTTNSTAKTNIESWYSTNMTAYTSQLEDTIYCNDRSVLDGNYGGWNKDSSATSYLYFAPRTRTYSNKSPSLKCTRNDDKFTTSTSTGNGKLTYPVGMITADEIAYAGAVYGSSNSNSSFYLYTGSKSLWSLSPSSFYSNIAYVVNLSSTGGLRSLDVVDYSYGLRPVVSLKPGTTISGGTGGPTDPYIVN